MLPIPQLPAIRARNNSLMVSPATVSRAGVPLSLTMPDGATLRCRITRDTKESRVEGASRLEEQTRWRISFPDGLDIRAGDQVTALGCIYGVVEVRNPTTYSIAAEAVAFMLFDANGVPVYLRPNATVRVLRAGTQVGPSSIMVRLEEPGEQRFTAMGGERLIQAFFPVGTDVRMTDDILILTYGNQSFSRPGPYEAQDVLRVGEIGMQKIRARLIGFTL